MTTISQLYEVYKQHPNVQTDTRLLSKGSIFFALKGDNFNGNSYAIQALEQGAAYAVVDDKSLENKKNCLYVQDVLVALQQLALHHRQQLDIPFLAITGSNGKTTTKELLAAVLSKKFTVLATKGNLNNHIGVPLTLLNITEEHDFAIIEMGANHKKEIASYCDWVLPNYGLINNCGKAHLEGFGGIQGVREGKGELYDFIRSNEGSIFRNADYDYLEEMATGIKKELTYGEFKGALRGKIYEHEPYLKIAILQKDKEQIMPTQLMGDYNLANVLAAVSVGDYFGVPFENISEAIAEYKPKNNRSEHKLVKGINVILDAYNANPSSMKAAMDSFHNLSQKNKILILGAMMELGVESDAEHTAVLKYAKNFPWKNIVTVGENFRTSASQIGVPNLKDASEAKQWFDKNVSKEDWVYIKGSRLTALEKIIID